MVQGGVGASWAAARVVAARRAARVRSFMVMDAGVVLVVTVDEMECGSGLGYRTLAGS